MLVFSKRFLIDFALDSKSDAKQPIQPPTTLQPAAPRSITELSQTERPTLVFSAQLPAYVRYAAQEGFRVFLVLTSSRRSEASKALIGEATCDLARLEELASQNPDAQFGLATGAGIMAVEMEGDVAVKRFFEMAGVALFYDDDNHWDWRTRMFRSGNTTWALFRCPSLPMRSRGRSLKCNITLLGDGDWLPIPGATFNNATCVDLNAEARIAEAPPFLLKPAFGLADPKHEALMPPDRPPSE